MKNLERHLYSTKSLCPDCLYPDRITIDAEVFEKDGKVMMRKICPEHGEFEDVVWSSAEMFHRAKEFARDGCKTENPHITKENPICPYDCGLCYEHKGHTALANLVVTNRCDLSCWYCFFYAEKTGYVYEPSLG